MTRWTIAALACAALMLLPEQAAADAYMIKDSRGVVYFTDTPPAGGTKYVTLKRYRTPRKAIPRRPPAAPSYRRSSFFSGYDHLINASASRHRLDPLLLKSVIKVESDFKRFSVSSKGALGLMQLLPGTARLTGVRNAFSPAQNIEGGSKYLRWQLDRFGGDLRLALAAYNAGPTTVSRYNGVPPYPETQRYIKKVFAAYESLANRAPARQQDHNGRRSSKTVFYTYTTPDGKTVITDMPIGKRRVLTD